MANVKNKTKTKPEEAAPIVAPAAKPTPEKGFSPLPRPDEEDAPEATTTDFCECARKHRRGKRCRVCGKTIEVKPKPES